MKNTLRLLLLLTVVILSVSLTLALDDVPPAPIENDEGGPVIIQGQYAYTDPTLPFDGTQPTVFLGDVSNLFIENGFDLAIEYLNTESPQYLATLTSDITESPFTYELSLPINPNGVLTDVDNDDQADTGVMVYTMNFTFNGIGDAFIDNREVIYFSSITYSPDSDKQYQFNGGAVLVYTTEEGQGFPSGFGDDELLFTEDDPIVTLPLGYTIVNLNADGFTFDRSSVGVMDVLESEGEEVPDFTELSYTEAFDQMIELLRKYYAFTEYKDIDWDAKSAEFRPRFEEAETNEDANAYALALQDFTWSIPDGHVGMNSTDYLDLLFLQQTDGGLGMAIRDVDDGRVITNFILEGGPAEAAGIELKAEIIDINGTSIDDAIAASVPWSSPFSAEHVERLQQLRYVIRFPVDTEVTITFQNPGDSEAKTVSLTTIAERDSFAFSSFNQGLTGTELPVEFEIMDNGYGYVKVFSFSDDFLLSMSLWKRALDTFNGFGTPGIIIDMRQNGGGSQAMQEAMAGYFFGDEPVYAGASASYAPDIDDFVLDPRSASYLPPAPEADRYAGAVAVLVGPNCNSACEFFAYSMTLEDRAVIVGQYPTGGLGGSIERFIMPDDILVQYAAGRAVGTDGEIHIEGNGVAPTVVVPVDEETLFSEGDPILDAAVAYLDEQTAIDIIEGAPIATGESVEGTLEPGQRANHAFNTGDGGVVNIVMESEAGAFVIILDTDGNILADGTSAEDPGWEELELPPNFDLVLQVMTANDEGSGTYTLSIVAQGE